MKVLLALLLATLLSTAAHGRIPDTFACWDYETGSVLICTYEGEGIRMELRTDRRNREERPAHTVRVFV